MAAALQQSLRIESDAGVAWIRLNRPERMNAINATLRHELAEALKQVERDPGVRCVVLTGEGRAFCSGADVKEFGERVAAGTPDPAIAAEYIGIVTRLRSMPKPTIAALNGVAAGIGASFALACDIRYAAPEAAIVEAFVKIGLTVDGGSSWLLPRLIGGGRALEMLFTGEPMPAAEAERLGLVNRVVPADQLEAAVQGLAATIAAGPPRAIAAIKRSVSHAETSSFAESVEFEFLLQGVQMAGTDFKEGIAAFAEKRKPVFTAE